MKNKDLLTKTETAHEFIEKLLFALGKYRGYSKLQPDLIHRTVFVCKGNICRSALAESYMRKKGFPAASLGLDCVDGKAANSTMLDVAEKSGVRLHEHKTTSLHSFKFLKGDLLVAMEPAQIKSLEQCEYPVDDIQFTLLGLYATSQRAAIIDPYGREDRFFEEIVSIIFECIDNLSHLLKKPGE